MTLFFQHLIGQFESVLPTETRALLCAHLHVYQEAFTVGDYEVYEQIGDAIIGHFIITYSYRTFPYLNSKEGVKIAARIRIKYTSSVTLAAIADSLGFWPHIVGVEENISVARKQALLEDVFEAFIGATNSIVDAQFGPGTGFIVCNAILSVVYKSVPIDLRYENLFDAKTRLKELCDFFRTRLTIVWSTVVHTPRTTDPITIALTYCVDGTKKVVQATARTKIDAEQKAALEVIESLRIQGIHKPPPDIFQTIAVAAAQK